MVYKTEEEFQLFVEQIQNVLVVSSRAILFELA